MWTHSMSAWKARATRRHPNTYMTARTCRSDLQSVARLGSVPQRGGQGGHQSGNGVCGIGYAPAVVRNCEMALAVGLLPRSGDMDRFTTPWEMALPPHYLEMWCILDFHSS